MVRRHAAVLLLAFICDVTCDLDQDNSCKEYFVLNWEKNGYPANFMVNYTDDEGNKLPATPPWPFGTKLSMAIRCYDDGYEASPPTDVICGPYGEWDLRAENGYRGMPQCVKKKCPKYILEQGMIIPHDWLDMRESSEQTWGDYVGVDLVCDTDRGWKPIGPPRATTECILTNSGNIVWTNPNLTCFRETCGPYQPEGTTHLVISPSSDENPTNPKIQALPGSNATYECDSRNGWVSGDKGSGISVCQVDKIGNARWSIPTLNCTRRTCPTFKPPAALGLIISEFSDINPSTTRGAWGADARYECDTANGWNPVDPDDEYSYYLCGHAQTPPPGSPGYPPMYPPSSSPTYPPTTAPKANTTSKDAFWFPLRLAKCAKAPSPSTR